MFLRPLKRLRNVLFCDKSRILLRCRAERLQFKWQGRNAQEVAISADALPLQVPATRDMTCKARQSKKSMGCRVGGGVARVNPYQSGQGKPPVHIAWFASHRPAAVTNFRGRLEVSLFPGGRRRLGPDNRGHRGMGMTPGEDK